MPSVRQHQPNIIICMVDQLRPSEAGCYGNTVVRTPNLDRFARGGVRFETAVSNNPLCMPARSCLLSGQYSRTCQGFLGNFTEVIASGVTTMPEQPSPRREWLKDPTIAEVLRASGYDTATIGKWHIQPAPGIVGFDHYLYPWVHHRYTGQTYIFPDGHEEVVNGFAPEFEARQIEQYLDNRATSERPFFLFYNISLPHMPLADAPEKYLKMYRPEDIPLRPNVFDAGGQLPADEYWFRIYLWDFLYYDQKLPHTTGPLDDFDLRKLTALYYGMATWADDLFGRMLRSLDANGLERDTIVLFTSDHGDMLGSHGMWNKGDLWEESIRIPLMLRGPGIPAGVVNRAQIATLVDLLPTLLGLTGMEVPKSVFGRSLLPVLAEEQACLNDNFAFIETYGHIGIRTPTHLLGLPLAQNQRDVAPGGEWFYDLTADPYEYRNLADTGQQKSMAGDLRARLLEWHASTPWQKPALCL